LARCPCPFLRKSEAQVTGNLWEQPRNLAINPNVVVVVNTGGGVNMTAWNNEVRAILYCWYPGQMGNKALAEILAGDVNPSGKLPITIEKKFEDSPGYPYLPENEKVEDGNWDVDANMSLPIYDINYKEGVFVGYRWYEAKNIEPLYPFGFGLSYTAFEYGKLKLSAEQLNKGETLNVQFELENSGDVAGMEVVQLYIKDEKSTVERPVKELKEFIKVQLEAGEKVLVEFEIDGKDLSFYDEKTAAWVAEPGKFEVLIGSSSKDILLREAFEQK